MSTKNSLTSSLKSLSDCALRGGCLEIVKRQIIDEHIPEDDDD